MVIPIAIYHERCGNGLSNRFKQKQKQLLQAKIVIKEPIIYKEKENTLHKSLKETTYEHTGLRSSQKKAK